MNNKPMNVSMKMKLLILLCLAALPPMSVRAADEARLAAEREQRIAAEQAQADELAKARKQQDD